MPPQQDPILSFYIHFAEKCPRQKLVPTQWLSAPPQWEILDPALTYTKFDILRTKLTEIKFNSNIHGWQWVHTVYLIQCNGTELSHFTTACKHKSELFFHCTGQSPSISVTTLYLTDRLTLILIQVTLCMLNVVLQLMIHHWRETLILALLHFL